MTSAGVKSDGGELVGGDDMSVDEYRSADQ